MSDICCTDLSLRWKSPVLQNFLYVVTESATAGCFCEPSEVNCSREICKHWNTVMVPGTTAEH